MHNQNRSQFFALLASLLVGCAPIDGGPDAPEPVSHVSQALSVTTCVPHNVYSIYAIEIGGDSSQPEWARQLVFPCGVRRPLDSNRGEGCSPYGFALPIHFTNSQPGVTPIGGYPATGQFMPVWALGAHQVSGAQRAIYVTEISGEALRQANGARLSYGELWQGFYRASMVRVNGYETNMFERWTVHAHRSLIYSADSSGLYRDELQYGANGFHATGLDMNTACNVVHPAMGAFVGYTSGVTHPWTSVRYVTCSQSESMRNARPVLSTTGVNPHSAIVTNKGLNLGSYIDALTGGSNVLDYGYPYYEPNNSSAYHTY